MVEKLMSPLIPTLSRDKIAAGYSFPVGAQDLTQALETSPHLPLMAARYCFRYGQVRELEQKIEADEPVIVLMISHYVHRRMTQGDHPFSIIIPAVPSSERRRVQRLILETLIPFHVLPWLNQIELSHDMEQNALTLYARLSDEEALAVVKEPKAICAR